LSICERRAVHKGGDKRNAKHRAASANKLGEA
jgi:hypothetical protein